MSGRIRGTARALLATAALAAAGAAGAQALYKCTTGHGRIEYRESGCAAGARETALRTGGVTGLDPIPHPRVLRPVARQPRLPASAPVTAPGAASTHEAQPLPGAGFSGVGQ